MSQVANVSDQDFSTFGGRVKFFRESLGLSQKQLADEVSKYASSVNIEGSAEQVTKNAIQSLESGRTQDFRNKHSLADALKVDLEFLKFGFKSGEPINNRCAQFARSFTRRRESLGLDQFECAQRIVKFLDQNSVLYILDHEPGEPTNLKAVERIELGQLALLHMNFEYDMINLACADLFGVDSHDFLSAGFEVSAPIRSGMVNVPRLAATASMGTGIDMSDNLDESIDEISVSKNWLQQNLSQFDSYSNLALISADGHSMSGTFESGDVLFADTTIRDFRSSAVYAFRRNGKIFIKRLQQMSDSSVKIISDNPLYENETVAPDQLTELEVIARIVGKLSSSLVS